LGKKEPTKIYEHGATWIFRINKLKGKFIDPDHVLFTLAGPVTDANCIAAYHDIKNELEETGVRTAGYDDKDEIVKFALN